MSVNFNVRPSDIFAVAATIDPASQSAAAHTSDWVSMETYDSVLAIIKTGALGTAATVDAKLQQATDSSGTSAKDIAGKSITQLVKASNDNDQALINCFAYELDRAAGFTHVALVITVGTAASLADGTIIGISAKVAPVSHLASMVEAVA